MGITVFEAMQLPTMKSTRLAAGASGIHNMIKWVTIVEVIEDINRLQEGEFLITTGYGLKEHDEHFQLLLGMKKLSGVAIYTGVYLEEIPEAFKAIAERNDLPLIEIPENINFSTISKEILQEILNKQMELTSLSLTIHKELTGLVLKNQSETSITETLTGLISASVYMMNEVNNEPHHVIRHEGISFENKQLFVNGKPIDLSRFINRAKSGKLPVTVDLSPFKAIIHPIIANDSSYGYLIALKEAEKWKEIDMTAIEHAVTVYAIELLKQSAVDETQLRLRGEFLEEIITKNYNSPALIQERGKMLGYDLSLTQAVFHVKFKKGSRLQTPKSAIQQLYNLAQVTMEQQNRQAIIKKRLDGITVLFELKRPEGKKPKDDSIKLAQLMLEKWEKKQTGIPLQIGIGNPYDDVNKLSDSAIEAKYACNLSGLLLAERELIHYDDINTFHLLLQMKEFGLDLKQFYETALGELVRSSKKGIDLLHTLEVYFKNNSNIQLTAAELFIHRHTLKYRLEQIKKKSGYDLASPDVRLKLQLALAAYKLDHYEITGE